MTTIAIDRHGTIAADGKRTLGSEICGLNYQKLRVSGDVVYAFTGLAPLLNVMVKWHQEGAKPENLPKGADKDGDGQAWTLIVVDRDGISKFTNTCPYIERFEPPVAFGSGQDFATGAMHAGASAKDAVEIACKLDVWSGGEIQVVNIAEALGLQIKEAAE